MPPLSKIEAVGNETSSPKSLAISLKIVLSAFADAAFCKAVCKTPSPPTNSFLICRNPGGPKEAMPPSISASIKFMSSSVVSRPVIARLVACPMVCATPAAMPRPKNVANCSPRLAAPVWGKIAYASIGRTTSGEARFSIVPAPEL